MGDKVTGALPTVASGASTDPEYQKEYFEALNQSLKALEGRQTPNLMQIASAFMNPGRSGSFGEALGNAMGVIGKQQEEQEARALPIAQMRAQLAGQKYEVGKEASILSKIANILGTDANPESVQTALGASIGNPAIMNKIAAIYPGTYGSPKIAEMLKNTFGMHNDLQKLVIEQVKANVPIAEILLNTPNAEPLLRQLNVLPAGYDKSKPETTTTPVATAAPVTTQAAPAATQATPVTVTIPSIFGADINARLTTGFKDGHYAVDMAVPGGTPIMSPTNATVLATGSDPKLGNYVKIQDENGYTHNVGHLSDILVKKGDQVQMGNPFGTVGATGNATGNHAHWITTNPEGKPVNPLDYFGVSRPEQKAQVAPVTQTEKPAQAVEQPAGKSTLYTQYDGTPIDVTGVPPGQITKYVQEEKNRYESRVKASQETTAKTYEKQLEGVANLKPSQLERNNKELNQVLTLLEDPEVKKYSGQMYKKGFVPGMLTAFDDVFKVGPFSASLPAYKVWLNSLPETAQEKFRNLDRYLGAAYVNAVSAKPFGGAPSNFEDIAIRNTIATSRDPASVIRNFSEEQKVTNKYLADIRRNYDAFNSSKPKDIYPHSYFGSPLYKKAEDDYNLNYEAVMANRRGR